MDRGRIVGAVLVIVLASPSGASAGNRFASPTGTSSPTCVQQTPCDIATAVNGAHAGDTVIVEPGSYDSSATLSDGSALGPITIEGQQSAAADPLIDVFGPSYGIELQNGSTVSHLRIDEHFPDAWGIYVAAKSSAIDHLAVHVDGVGSGACYVAGTLIDSVCWASGNNDTGFGLSTVASASATLRNDTVIASGTGGRAVVVNPQVSSQMTTVDMTNTIARGTAADLYVGAAPGATATIAADHSNFATVANAGGGGTITAPSAGSGTNQTAAPQFTFPWFGDFHEFSSSPTVGAGVVSASNGATDLVGSPRAFQGRTDIGALEFIPPPTCQPVSAATAIGTIITVKLHCTDVLGADLSYNIVRQPAHGALGLTSGNEVLYTPLPRFTGVDTFTYNASSSHGTSAAVTGSVTVQAPPVLSRLKLHDRRLRFTLTEAASVTLTLSERGHKRRTVKLKGKAGGNSYKLKRLNPGTYELGLVARNAFGTSRPVRLKLTIKH